MGDCGGPPAPGEDPMLGTSWLSEDTTSEPLSRIVTLWRGRPTLWQIACRGCCDFPAKAANQPGETILVLRSASAGLKLQEVVVQEGGPVLLWPSTSCDVRALARPDTPSRTRGSRLP